MGASDLVDLVKAFLGADIDGVVLDGDDPGGIDPGVARTIGNVTRVPPGHGAERRARGA